VRSHQPASHLPQAFALLVAQYREERRSLHLLDRPAGFLVDRAPLLGALTTLSLTLKEAGDERGAKELLDEVLEVAQDSKDLSKIGWEPRVDWKLSRVAAVLFRVGCYDWAAQVGRSIKDGQLQALALHPVVKALAEAERYDLALEVARDIESDPCRLDALTHVAAALAEAGERDRAEGLVDEAVKATRAMEGYYNWQQAKGSTSLMRALAERERYDVALKVAGDIKLDQDRAEALFREAVRIVRTRPKGKVLTFLRDVGRVSDALALLALADFQDINEFLQDLRMWLRTFERLQSGLSVIVLREFTEVAGWSNPHWRRVHELIQTAEPAK
jgi:tetratricopeptide (TPR) repeat protein